MFKKAPKQPALVFTYSVGVETEWGQLSIYIQPLLLDLE